MYDEEMYNLSNFTSWFIRQIPFMLVCTEISAKSMIMNDPQYGTNTDVNDTFVWRIYARN